MQTMFKISQLALPIEVQDPSSADEIVNTARLAGCKARLQAIESGILEYSKLKSIYSAAYHAVKRHYSRQFGIPLKKYVQNKSAPIKDPAKAIEKLKQKISAVAA